jgi:hypothetical protein
MNSRFSINNKGRKLLFSYVLNIIKLGFLCLKK